MQPKNTNETDDNPDPEGLRSPKKKRKLTERERQQNQRTIEVINRIMQEQQLESMRDVADFLGVAHSSFSQIKNNKRRVNSKIIEALKTIGENVDYIENGYLTNDIVKIPIVTVAARASFDSNLEGIQETDLPDYFKVPSSYVKGYEKAVLRIFEVNGDSMEPRLRSGDKILAVKIDRGNWFIQSNDIFVVEFGNTLTVKRIRKNTLEHTGTLTLHPDNTQFAEPQEIKVDDIRSIWRAFKIVDSKSI